MNAHRSTRKQMEIAQRRLRVARAYCEGKNSYQIAAAEGVNQGTISRDLTAIRNEWKEARHGLIDARVAEELARIDHLEAVAWEAWERSCEDAQTHKTRKVKGKTAIEVVEVTDDKGKTKKRRPVQLPDIDMAEMVRRGQSGKPAFLERVSWCIHRRIILLGLDPSKTMVLPPREEGDDGLSDEERSAALLRIIAEMGLRVVPEDSQGEGVETGIPLLGGPVALDEGGGHGVGPVAGEPTAGALDEGPPPLFPTSG